MADKEELLASVIRIENLLDAHIRDMASKPIADALGLRDIFFVADLLCAPKKTVPNTKAMRKFIRMLHANLRSEGFDTRTIKPGMHRGDLYVSILQMLACGMYDAGRQAGTEAARKSTFKIAHDMGYEEGLATGKGMRTYHFRIANFDMNPVIACTETLRLVSEGIEVFNLGVTCLDDFFGNEVDVQNWCPLTIGITIDVMAGLARSNHRTVRAVNTECALLINGKEYAGSIEVDFNTGRGTFSVS